MSPSGIKRNKGSKDVSKTKPWECGEHTDFSTLHRPPLKKIKDLFSPPVLVVFSSVFVGFHGSIYHVLPLALPPWFEPGVFAPKKSLLEVPFFYKRQWGEVKVAEVRWCGQISLTKTTDIGKTHSSLYLLHVTWHGFILYTITWVFFVETYLPFVFQNLHKHQIIVISHQVSSLEPPFYTPKLTSEVVGGVGSLRKTCWYCNQRF